MNKRELQVKVLELEAELAETKQAKPVQSLGMKTVPAVGGCTCGYEAVLRGLYRRLKGDPTNHLLHIVKEALGLK